MDPSNWAKRSCSSSYPHPTSCSRMKSRKRRVCSQHLPGTCSETVMEEKLWGSGCDKGAEFCFCCYTKAYGFHPQENLLLSHTNTRMKEKDFAMECFSSLGTCHEAFRLYSSTELKETVQFQRFCSDSVFPTVSIIVPMSQCHSSFSSVFSSWDVLRPS